MPDRTILIDQVKKKIIDGKSKNEVLYQMFFPDGNHDKNDDVFKDQIALLPDDILEHFDVTNSDKNRIVMNTSTSAGKNTDIKIDTVKLNPEDPKLPGDIDSAVAAAAVAIAAAAAAVTDDATKASVLDAAKEVLGNIDNDDTTESSTKLNNIANDINKTDLNALAAAIAAQIAAIAVASDLDPVTIKNDVKSSVEKFIEISPTTYAVAAAATADKTKPKHSMRAG